MQNRTLTLLVLDNYLDYIFQTSGLNAIIGRLGSLSRLLGSELMAALPTRHNLLLQNNHRLLRFEMPSTELDAEVIYAAGGQVLIAFASRELAEAFCGRFSQYILIKFPEVRLLIAHQEIDNLEQLHLSELQSKINQRRKSQHWSVPLMGIGVAAEQTLWSISEIDREIQKQGYEQIVEMILPFSQTNIHLVSPNKFFPITSPSFTAVSYIESNNPDGFLNALDLNAKKSSDQHLVYQSHIESMDKIFRRSFQKTVSYFLQNNGLKTDKLPLIPVYIQGDNKIVFLSPGRVGLRLTSFFLRCIEEEQQQNYGRLYFHSGVALIRSDIPIAYGLKLARQLVTNTPLSNYLNTSTMDWHIVQSELLQDLWKAREQDYQTRYGSLLMRPLAIGSTESWRNWDVFDKLVSYFSVEQQPDNSGISRRKLIALSRALCNGPDSTRQFLGNNRLLEIPGAPQMSEFGWAAGRCGYYDAIEALQFRLVDIR